MRTVVTLTRLTGSVFALNSDLIERVESTAGTLITLVDGTEYIVRESLQEVVDRIRRYRGSVIASASHLELAGDSREPTRDRKARKASSVVPFPNREI